MYFDESSAADTEPGLKAGKMSGYSSSNEAERFIRPRDDMSATSVPSICHRRVDSILPRVPMGRCSGFSSYGVATGDFVEIAFDNNEVEYCKQYCDIGAY